MYGRCNFQAGTLPPRRRNFSAIAYRMDLRSQGYNLEIEPSDRRSVRYRLD